MTLRELKSLVEMKLTKIYPHYILDNKYIFQSKQEEFKVDAIRAKNDGDNSLVIDYIKSGDDGDRFYPSDYNYDLDKMVDDMIKEIEEPIED